MRIVLDTNVLAAVMLWGGAPVAQLETACAKRLSLYTSTALLAELTDILMRRKFAKTILAPGFTTDALVDRYADLDSWSGPIR